MRCLKAKKKTNFNLGILKSLIKKQTDIFLKDVKQIKINQQGGTIFQVLSNKLAENLQTGWEKNLKNQSEHALLLGT